MIGFLRNLSAQALERSASVRSVARLPYAALPAMSEMPASERISPLPAAAPIASVAAPPDMGDPNAQSEPDIVHWTPPLLLPRRQHDPSDAPLSAHAMRKPADREIAASTMHPLAEPVVAAGPVSTPPALVPTALNFVAPPAFITRPLDAAANTARAHRQSTDGETTEVHVSIGRIELTAVQEASPPARRVAPVKSSLSLHEYLARGRGRPS